MTACRCRLFSERLFFLFDFARSFGQQSLTMHFQTSLIALFASTALGIALPAPLPPQIGNLAPLGGLPPLPSTPLAGTPNAGGPAPSMPQSGHEASFPKLNVDVVSGGLSPPAPSGTGTGPPKQTGWTMMSKRSKPIRRAI